MIQKYLALIVLILIVPNEAMEFQGEGYGFGNEGFKNLQKRVQNRLSLDNIRNQFNKLKVNLGVLPEEKVPLETVGKAKPFPVSDFAAKDVESKKYVEGLGVDRIKELGKLVNDHLETLGNEKSIIFRKAANVPQDVIRREVASGKPLDLAPENAAVALKDISLSNFANNPHIKAIFESNAQGEDLKALIRAETPKLSEKDRVILETLATEMKNPKLRINEDGAIGANRLMAASLQRLTSIDPALALRHEEIGKAFLEVFNARPLNHKSSTSTLFEEGKEHDLLDLSGMNMRNDKNYLGRKKAVRVNKQTSDEEDQLAFGGVSRRMPVRRRQFSGNSANSIDSTASENSIDSDVTLNSPNN